jgi:glycosyltransferase involved in cell wall biosynthesis
VGGVAEAIIDSKTGFLAPCGDEFAFRARLRELIERPALRGKMGAAGRRRYETEFTLESMLRKTLAVYQEVLDGRPRANAVAVSTAHYPEVPVDL